MMCLDYIFLLGPNVPILRKNRGLKWVKLSKSGCFDVCELNTSSYRDFYGLSENLKIIEIGVTKVEL